MAKLSLSQIFEKRKRIRILTFLATLLLLVVFGGLITRYPKQGKAANMINDKYGVPIYNLDDTNKAITVYGSLPSSTMHFLLENNTICPIPNNGDGNSCDSSQPAGTTTAIPVDWSFSFVGTTGLTPPNTVYAKGANTFINFTVNNGIISHPAIIGGDAMAVSEINKKIDLTLNGNLELNSGGKINVDGKGYAGGITPTIAADLPNAVGKGPGGGAGAICGDICWAGGGAYGGNGGTVGSPGGVAYSNYADAPTNLQVGSGGGGASSTDQASRYRGGNGGGRIKLKVTGKIRFNSSDSTISSNGQDGYCESRCDLDHPASGGGAAGSIWINASGVDYNYDSGAFTAISYSGNDSSGAIGTFTMSGTWNDSNGIFNIMAIGGKGGTIGPNVGGGGGGGRINLEQITEQTVTIQKKLLPVDRGNDDRITPGTGYCDSTGWDNINEHPSDADCDYNFNPYALQKDDEIMVDETITNVAPGLLTLTDDILQIPYSAVRCEPDFTAGSPTLHVINSRSGPTPTASFTSGSKQATISVTIPDGTTSVRWMYWCKVKSE